MQARYQLGSPGGEEFSERRPNFLNYVQHIFPGGGAKIAQPPPLVTGLMYGMLVCNAIIVSTISRKLHAVVGVMIIVCGR